MSNSSSSPVVLRIQQSAVVFVVLLLALGALVLAANNIDPNASVRGDIRYTLWKSSNGIFSMEYPAGWSIKQVTGVIQYQIAPDDGTAQGLMGLGSVAGYGLNITDADKNPKNLLDQILAKQTPQGAVTERSIAVDGIQGYAGTLEIPQSDPTTGETTVQESELWVIPLDGTHFLATNITSKGATSTTIQPLWDHMMNTLIINKQAALRAMGVGVPTATPTTAPTQAATEVATGASTQAATSAATAAATAAP